MFDTFVAKYRGYMRFSYGVSDWRGIGGSLGGTASATPAVATPPVNTATAIAVTTCVNGATLVAWVNGAIAATVTTSGTTKSITVPALATGDVCYVVQTESGKVPTESAKITVTAA